MQSCVTSVLPRVGQKMDQPDVRIAAISALSATSNALLPAVSVRVLSAPYDTRRHTTDACSHAAADTAQPQQSTCITTISTIHWWLYCIQSHLVISNSDNSNFRLYRGRTLVPAASDCNRREKASDLSNTAISNSLLYRVCSAAPHVHGGVVYIEVG